MRGARAAAAATTEGCAMFEGVPSRWSRKWPRSSTSSPSPMCTLIRVWLVGWAAGTPSCAPSWSASGPGRPRPPTPPPPMSWRPRMHRSPRTPAPRTRPRRHWPTSCDCCWCRATPWTARTSSSKIKAGEGGAESALFAADLMRMYLRYAERRGWPGRGARQRGIRPRRDQGRCDRCQEPRAGAAGRRALRPIEVRGRGAPRPASPGDRVCRTYPYLRCGRAGAARS